MIFLLCTSISLVLIYILLPVSFWRTMAMLLTGILKTLSMGGWQRLSLVFVYVSLLSCNLHTWYLSLWMAKSSQLTTPREGTDWCVVTEWLNSPVPGKKKNNNKTINLTMFWKSRQPVTVAVQCNGILNPLNSAAWAIYTFKKKKQQKTHTKKPRTRIFNFSIFL